MNYTIDQVKKMVEGSYKKFKSYYFYDKSLLYIKKKIALFEDDSEMFRKSLDSLAEAIIKEDFKYFDELLSKLDFRVFPKSLVSTQEFSSTIIGSTDHKKNVSKINFFIDVPIELMIFDCLWTILIAKISQTMYDENSHSYAGKFKKSIFIFGEQDLYSGIDFDSSRCFEPYYENYSKWQQDAFSALKEELPKHNQIMFSLDLKSFYYSVRFEFESLKQLLNDDQRLQEIAFLTAIIEKIYLKYTSVISKYKIGIDIKTTENATIFPIGLLSPVVLRELYLFKFDRDLQEKLQPIHYGRYVDDMIVVISTDIKPKDVTSDSICQFLKDRDLILNRYNTQDEDYLFKEFPTIAIQKSKINCFFFEQGSTNILIDVVERQIRNNSSEANLLPEFDLIDNNFNDVAYFFNSTGGSTKIRDIGILQSNNYAASRSITQIKQLIKNTDIQQEDRAQITKFINSIIDFYDGSAAFEFMGSWVSVFELIIQFKVLSNSPSGNDPLADKFYKNIRHYIDSELSFDSLNEKEVFSRKKKTLFKRMQLDLRDRLSTSIALAMALDYTWRTWSEKKIRNITLARKFRKSNIFNHQLVSFPLLNYLPFDQISECSLVKIYREPWDEFTTYKLDDERLKWTPRYIHLDELFIYHFMQSTQRNGGKKGLVDINSIHRKYLKINQTERFSTSDIIEQHSTFSEDYNVTIAEVSAYNDSMPMYTVALANTPVTEADALQSLLQPAHNMTIKDKERLFRMANNAVKEKAGFITFPEFYLPIAWLKDITRFAQKNNITVITGLRYIRNAHRAYNCTAIVQPCNNNGFQNAVALFREKNYYAPEEKEYLYKLGYHVENPAIPIYYIVDASGMKYSTILCYEFTDINSRASLKSKIDALFVPQLNKDTNYFSSIVESSSRDLHCFIIQANTSKYGDSRITAPYDTIHKNIVQIKGGDNDAIIIGKLDIPALYNAREEYRRQRSEIEKHCFNCRKVKKLSYPDFFEACKKCKFATKKIYIKDVPPKF